MHRVSNLEDMDPIVNPYIRDLDINFNPKP